ncbi:dihydroflavonol-4-reductase [Caulobacter ginsengisoli]|uniref:Dihydroflavonol-4-reductase n=1 Tax=Caulobacter ginsengisoli TaxID=400775 RepID=A0ABU0IS60_9CAUL|nr:aldehyde reductase [Caulobacter ginsengisoli]MDQ0464847.1 dihydroflavonol-4-reductase [Caulobacter ginsengisoli]
MADDKGLVLVSGGSGYIAGFCIAQLLAEGWSVRATVRSLAREAEVRKQLSAIAPDLSKLSFAAADLNADAGWPEAVAGCQYVLHVASPLPIANIKSDDELVRPARDGALRVLKAARDAGVKRVVMTASTAAIAYGHGSRKTPFTEADWSDETNLKDTSAYERSKTIAEKAAWAWLAAEGNGLELVTINPVLVLGPVLGSDFSGSIEAVKKMLEGSFPGIPNFGWAIVDVRDVADLHLRAMTDPAANGGRFIASSEFWWMRQIADLLKARLGKAAAKVPTRQLPDWLIRIVGQFDPVVKERLFELGKERPVSAEKARTLLGWRPRSNEEAVMATAESLLALGLVK